MINTPFPEVGQKVRLAFPLPNDPVPVECEVRVAWQNPPSISKGLGSVATGLPPGCGVEFVDLDLFDQERLSRRVGATRS
jgi:hypothetical protein